jgi:hypothetical protein
MQPTVQQAKLARPNLLGCNLQSSLLIGEIAGLHTSLVKKASNAQGYNFPRLRFLLTPPTSAKAPQAVNGQGGIDEGLYDGVDEAINSRASTAALVLGGKETSEESTKECCISISSL